MMSPPPSESPKRQTDSRILIVRLSAHGDVIHTLPLLTSIKKERPHAMVGWLVEASAAPLLENHPFIDFLHVSHRKRWLKMARNPLQWAAILAEIMHLIRELKQSSYEISFDVQGLTKSAIWPLLANIPHRYGFKATRESADIFYNHKLPPMIIRDGKIPAVESYLNFARAIGIPLEGAEFSLPPVSEAVQQKVTSLLSAANPALPLVVVAPFTRWSSKQWEPDYWTRLLQALCQLDIQLVILGSPDDQQAAEALLSAVPLGKVINLIGKTDWPDLYALFPRVRLLIGLDSAPLHIADAVGTPEIIGLYGPTAPGRTGPVGQKHMTLTTALACQPCFERRCPLKTHDCMKQLTPEVVLALVRKTLAYPPSGNSEDYHNNAEKAARR